MMMSDDEAEEDGWMDGWVGDNDDEK